MPYITLRFYAELNQGLLKRSIVTHAYYVRATQGRGQLREVLRRFDLAAAMRPFSRCLRCNGKVREGAKARVAAQLPPHVRATQEEFRQCETCRRVYAGIL